MNRKTEIFKKLSFIARTIKASLAMVIPILFIGSFAVMLNGFPVQAYQDFLDSFLGGALRAVLTAIQTTTVGVLAIYITVALNLSYMNQTEAGQRLVFRFGSLLCCINGFCILSGLFSGEPDVSLLSGSGVFSAMVAGIVGSVLFRKFETCFGTQKMVFVDGADSEFNAALHVVLPFLCVTFVFAATNHLITVCFQVQSVQHLFMKAVEAIFLKMQRSYSSGLLFTTLTSIMWWFGIHGNNVLNKVAEDMFTVIIPGETVSKSFIDTFVNMGGTGCTIGLLITMFVFGRRSSTRKLSGMALLPCIFNIGELMVFGFPIIYNPLMIVPFILAPTLCFTNAYLLTKIGFLPQVANSVVWTTPALMSGYIATGSVRGIVVQLLNIFISSACYAPFVIRQEKKALDEFSSSMSSLLGLFKNSEEHSEEISLIECEGKTGRFAKHLAMDLETAIAVSSRDAGSDTAENPLLIDYQPQYDSEGKCTGAEALLRWNHKRYGIIYPPLIIEIARESGDLYQLETYIIERAVHDSESFRKKYGGEFILSINVTVSTLCDKRFIPFLQSVADRCRLKAGNICLEIREDPNPANTDKIVEHIGMIRPYGYIFAIDDFKMGHNSLQYLQHNQFDMVKLDAALVGTFLDNDHEKEIVNSVIYLSKSLNLRVAAKYVKTGEQKEALKQAGCLLYQGELFTYDGIIRNDEASVM